MKYPEQVHTVSLLLGEGNTREIKMGYNNQIDLLAITKSNFTISPFVSPTSKHERIVGISDNSGEPLITVWNLGDDDIYRSEYDIDIKNDKGLIITKMMPDGSERRVDLNIVL